MHLKYAQFALNNTVSTSTEFDPNEVVFGRKPVLPIDLACRALQDTKVHNVDVYIRA